MLQQNTSLHLEDCHTGVMQRYGTEFLEDLEKCRTNPFWNLAAVGRKYGISRERVRVLYKKVYNEHYQPKKTELIRRKNTELSCSNDPRNKVNFIPSDSPQGKGAFAEREFLQRCEAFGFNVEIPCSRSVDLYVNGCSVDVKSSTKTHQTSPHNSVHYHLYSLKGEQIDKAEFFACYHPKEDSFFIIPNKWKGYNKDQVINIYIAEQKSHSWNAQNKHWEYKDRYDLLNQT